MKVLMPALAIVASLSVFADPEPAADAPAAEPAVAEAPAPQTVTDEINLDEVDDSADARASQPVITSAEAEGEALVDISCENATLADVLRQFRKVTNENIISDDASNLQCRVSANLHHVPWYDGLQSILNLRGFRLEERGRIFFVRQDKVIEPTFTRPITLKHASAAELAEMFNTTYAKKDQRGQVSQPIATCFDGANVIVITATEKVINDCEAIIKAVDKAVAQIYIEARFLELSSEAMHKLGMQWNSLESWGVSAKGFKAGWEFNDGKPSDYGTFVTKRDSTLTANKTANTNGGESPSTSANSTDSSTFTDTLTGLVPNEIKEATAAGLSAASMGWQKASGFSGQLSADDFRIALSAFEEFGEGKIFSNPKIIVSNGREAKVDMTTKEPNVTVSADYTGVNSQNLSISTKLDVIPGEDKQMFAKEAFFSYGIELSVKPRISPDGLISVEIVPTISEKADEKKIAGAEQAIYTSYPIISVKRLTTEFTMKSGSTAVIGGLTQTVEEDIDSGIPYLRKIPWIGQKLFGWKSRGKVQKEIIVCVTVGIANPEDLPTDIGLPKNAVIGREYISGKRLEPGDRGDDSRKVLQLDLSDVPHEPINRKPDSSKVYEITIPNDTADEPVTTVSIAPSK